MRHLSSDTNSRLKRHFGYRARAGEEGTFANAAEVAAKLDPEEPVFCFSPRALKDRIGEFIGNFPGEVSYAVKANPGEQVVLALAANGLSVFDVASVHEMRGIRASVPRARFHYHNPVKSRREIEEAFGTYGCTRFAADDRSEIAKIAEVTGAAAGVAIAVRFRLPRLGGSSMHDFSSKFGATRQEAAELLMDVAARGFCPVLTFHPGSQCTDPQAYARHIASAAKISRRAGVELFAVNVGGGFPARYHGAAVPSLRVFFAVIAASTSREFGCNVPRLECEPGRGLVAGSTSLLTRVKLVKPARSEVFINDGIYGGLLEIHQAPGLVPPARAIRDGRFLARDLRAWTVHGPTCDPLDRLPVRFLLPADLSEGDFIEFGSLGAYGAATSTRFNGYGGAATHVVHSVLQADA